MPTFGRETAEFARSHGLSPHSVQDALNRPSNISPQSVQRVKKAALLSGFCKNELVSSFISRKLALMAVFGDYEKYLRPMQNYAPVSFVVPAVWETPKTIFKKFQCVAGFYFEGYPDLPELAEIEKPIFLINPIRTQNIFCEINGDRDVVVHVCMNLLKFYNSLYPFKVSV